MRSCRSRYTTTIITDNNRSFTIKNPKKRTSNKKKKKKILNMITKSCTDDTDNTNIDFETKQINLFRNYELRTIAKAEKKKRLPTCIISGHLGSGKTTLLKHVLENAQGMKIVCAVNDYAAINVDAEMVKMSSSSSSSTRNEVVELTNGCVCCSLQEKFEDDVARILNREQVERCEYLFVETSGIVDPTGLVLSLDRAFGKFARVRLDCVCTVVDAEVAERGGAEYEREAWFSQIRVADVVILNKIDLLENDEQRVALAVKNIKEAMMMNTDDEDVHIIPIERGKINIERIIDAKFDIYEPEGKQGTDLNSAQRRLVVSDYGDSLSQLGKLRKTPKNLLGNNVSVDTKGLIKLGSHSKTFKTTLNLKEVDINNNGMKISDAIDFETLETLHFSKFQKWIRERTKKSNCARAKGFVRFTSNDYLLNGLWDVSVSGRGRVEVNPIHSNEAKFSLPGSRLVVIGNQLIVEDEMNAMRALCSSTSIDDDDDDDGFYRNDNNNKFEIENSIEIMKADARFEIDGNHIAEREGFVQFRLIGAKNNGWTVETIERTHGVDINAMNISFAQKFNAMTTAEFALVLDNNNNNKNNNNNDRSSRKIIDGETKVGLLLASENIGETRKTHFRQPTVTLKAFVGGLTANEFETFWSCAQYVGTATLAKYLAHVPKCSCAF